MPTTGARIVDRGKKIEPTEVLIMPPRETRECSRFRFTDDQHIFVSTAERDISQISSFTISNEMKLFNAIPGKRFTFVLIEEIDRKHIII